MTTLVTSKVEKDSQLTVCIPDSDLRLVFSMNLKKVARVSVYTNEDKKLATFSGKEYIEMLSKYFTESEMKYLDEVEEKNDLSRLPRKVLKDIIALRLDEYAKKASHCYK